MKELLVSQHNQITAFNCIPACLQQVFSYYNRQLTQEDITRGLEYPKRGMSLPAAASFAQQQGFGTAIVTNNIQIFDPVWFSSASKELTENLKKRRKFVDEYNQSLIDDLIEYLDLNGRIDFSTICDDLIRKYLSQDIPIIMELASTFLYKKSKSTEPGTFNDPIKGTVEGHGIVIAGFDQEKFKIIDPDTRNNPYDDSGIYWISSKDLLMSFAILEGKSLLLIGKDSIRIPR